MKMLAMALVVAASAVSIYYSTKLRKQIEHLAKKLGED